MQYNLQLLFQEEYDRGRVGTRFRSRESSFHRQLFTAGFTFISKQRGKRKIGFLYLFFISSKVLDRDLGK